MTGRVRRETATPKPHNNYLFFSSLLEWRDDSLSSLSPRFHSCGGKGSRLSGQLEALPVSFRTEIAGQFFEGIKGDLSFRISCGGSYLGKDRNRCREGNYLFSWPEYFFLFLFLIDIKLLNN